MNQMEWTKYCNTHLYGLQVLIQSVWIETQKSRAKFRICQIQLFLKLATYDKLEELGKKNEIWNPTNKFFGWSFIAVAISVVVA